MNLHDVNIKKIGKNSVRMICYTISMRLFVLFYNKTFPLITTIRPYEVLNS